MWNRQEEELRLSGEYKYSHLSEDLHVEIQTFAPPAEAHARIAYALAEVRRFLVPVSIGKIYLPDYYYYYCISITIIIIFMMIILNVK